MLLSFPPGHLCYCPISSPFVWCSVEVSYSILSAGCHSGRNLEISFSRRTPAALKPQYFSAVGTGWLLIEQWQKSDLTKVCFCFCLISPWQSCLDICIETGQMKGPASDFASWPLHRDIGISFFTASCFSSRLPEVLWELSIHFSSYEPLGSPWKQQRPVWSTPFLWKPERQVLGLGQKVGNVWVCPQGMGEAL